MAFTVNDWYNMQYLSSHLCLASLAVIVTHIVRSLKSINPHRCVQETTEEDGETGVHSKLHRISFV